MSLALLGGAAAAVQASAVHARHQPAVRLEEADRVEMPVQDQRPAAAAPPSNANDIRPSRHDLVDMDVEPGTLEPLRIHLCDGGLAAAGRDARRIDGVDGDQLRRQLRRHQIRTTSPSSAER